MPEPAPRLELLWWSGCPSTEAARALLERTLADVGLDPAALQLREIRTQRDAEREGFIGSPTIRIDGGDVMLAAAGETPSLTCRVYRRRDGRFSPLPDPDDLRDALRGAIAVGRPTGGPLVSATATLDLGAVAPDFTLPDVAGRPWTLRGPAGADEPPAPATVVLVTCNHCPYALAWHERLLAVGRDYAGRGVRLLAINGNDSRRYPHDSPEAMRRRVAEEGEWPMPYLHDEAQTTLRAYGATVTPELFVLGPDLRLQYHGAPDADHDDPSQNARWLRDALDDVLAEREVAQPLTAPVGCSVKWRE